MYKPKTGPKVAIICCSKGTDFHKTTGGGTHRSTNQKFCQAGSSLLKCVQVFQQNFQFFFQISLTPELQYENITITQNRNVNFSIFSQGDMNFMHEHRWTPPVGLIVRAASLVAPRGKRIFSRCQIHLDIVKKNPIGQARLNINMTIGKHPFKPYRHLNRQAFPTGVPSVSLE